MIKLQKFLCFMMTSLLVLCFYPHKNLAAVQTDEIAQDVCTSEKDSVPCSASSGVNGEKAYVKVEEEMFHQEQEYTKENCAKSPIGAGESDSLLHRSMQGLEGVIDKMSHSKDEMMNNFMDKMSESRTKMMERIDSMMDKMSESGTKVKEGFDSMMEKVSQSKEKMIKGLDNVLDQVSHSKMMEEIDHVIETVSHSQMLKEIRALPQELRESFILSARNRSYIYAGVLVAIAAAILFGGAIYYAWCHHDAWSYYIGTIDEAKALLRQAKESRFGRLSRSSSETEDVNNTVSDNLSSTLHENSSQVEDTNIQNGDIHTNENNQNFVSSRSDSVNESEHMLEKVNGCELKGELLMETKDNISESNNGDASVVSTKRNNKHSDEIGCNGLLVEGKKDK